MLASEGRPPRQVYMTQTQAERRLTAVMFTDIVGYTSLTSG